MLSLKTNDSTTKDKNTVSFKKDKKRALKHVRSKDPASISDTEYDYGMTTTGDLVKAKKVKKIADTEESGPAETSESKEFRRTPEFLKQQWMERYQELKHYRTVHGNCNVPQREKHLGCWVSTQRTQYKLMLEGRPSQMSKERIELLKLLQFDWDPRKIFTRVFNPGAPATEGEAKSCGADRNERKWMQWYEELRAFRQQYRHCIVTRSANNSLGIWIQKQRKLYRDTKSGKKSKHLTEERIKLLEDIGFAWELSPSSRPTKEKLHKIPGLLEKKWQERYEQLKEYKQQHGDCLVPEKKTEWAKLGSWVSTQRKKCDDLPVERKKLLDDLGFEWDVSTDGKRTKVWHQKVAQLLKYKALNGHFNVVPTDPATSSLADWVTRQRYSYIHLWNGKYSPLTEDRVRLLNEIGFPWTRADSLRAPNTWDDHFEKLCEFKKEYGHCIVPRNHAQLGDWVDTQRLNFRAMMTQGQHQPKGEQVMISWEQFSRLESIGFEFSVKASAPVTDADR